MTKWPTVPAGDVLELIRRPVAPEPSVDYTEIGTRSFGKGIFHKPPVAGIDLATKRVFKIGTGELVVNIVFAWEGAVAVSGDGEVGTIGSHRFLTYLADANRADLQFIRAYLISEPGREALLAASPGSAGRNRTLSRAAFERLLVPLPPLDQQRRIAARIDHSRRACDSITAATTGPTSIASDAAIEAIVAKLPSDGWRPERIGAVAEVNPRRRQLSLDSVIDFVPMNAVDDMSGQIQRPQRRTAAEVATGYTQFLAGDVIFARITPCMQNGKAAEYGPARGSVAGYGSTEFHVLRGREVSAAWLHVWVRRARFRREAMSSFTGTAGQQRVPASFVADAEILIAPDEAAEASAIARIRLIERTGLALRGRDSQRRALLGSLGPAMVNEVFSGRL